MRVALYARVSTEEQARHGISIDAQVDAMHRWAGEQGHTIIGDYIDNGISARKSPSKRPALQELLQDIPEKKIELIAFCKLDRWTRNVKGYYQVQEVLDKYKVAWAAIQEDYETITASGRFKVNIMLSVAENEADRTSERIKAVYNHKVALGQPINGNVPLGLKIDDKRMIPDKFASAVVAAYQCYADTGSRNTVQRVLDGYGKHLSLQSISRLLRNKLYIGEYRDNKSYCEPIISRELFDRVQRDLQMHSVKHTPSGRVYLFSSLIFCGVCGRKMAAIFANHSTVYYRCVCGNKNYKDCPNSNYIREDILEGSIVSQLAELVKGKSQVVRQARTTPSNKAAIERKLKRLQDLYIDGDITKEQYAARRDELSALIVPKKDDKPKIILGDRFEEDYMRLTRQQKAVFFRRVIDRIVVSENSEIDVYFADVYTSGNATDVDLS